MRLKRSLFGFNAVFEVLSLFEWVYLGFRIWLVDSWIRFKLDLCGDDTLVWVMS